MQCTGLSRLCIIPYQFASLSNILALNSQDRFVKQFHSIYIVVNCIWNTWNGWNDCSATCGTGIRSATRTKQTVEEYGGKCEGESFREESCNAPACPSPGGINTNLIWLTNTLIKKVLYLDSFLFNYCKL